MDQGLLPMAGACHPTPGLTRIPLDAYYTDLALARRCVSLLPIERHDLVMEPHVGGGSFAQALIELTDARIHVRDINPHAPGLSKNVDARTVGDFLSWRPVDTMVYGTPTEAQRPEWVVGNPPYGDALMAHVSHALRVSRRHVVMLVRLAILESGGRISFWSEYGLRVRGLWVLAHRPKFRTDTSNTDTAAYVWLWFDKAHNGPPQHFVPSWDWKRSLEATEQLTLELSP